MSTAARSGRASGTSKSPDVLFRFVVGAYAALLVVPFAVLIGASSGVSDPAVLYGLLVIGGLLFAGAVTRVTRRFEGGSLRLGGTPARWLLPSPGVGLALGSFALLPRVGGVAMVGFFFGAVSVIAGFLVAAMARSRYVVAVLEREPVEASWTAEWPTAARRRCTIAASGLMAVGLLSVIIGLTFHRDVLWIAGQFLAPVGFSVVNYSQEHDYAASPAGLAVQQGGFRQLHRWDGFSGYTRTDDAIVCHRPRRVDFRFAISDLDEPAAIEKSLERYLS